MREAFFFPMASWHLLQMAHRAGEFLLRGLEKVDLEWRLVLRAYNLQRLAALRGWQGRLFAPPRLAYGTAASFGIKPARSLPVRISSPTSS
jgi:hypothetical protein